MTYSPGDHLHELLRSLPEATGEPVRVVMADNGSTDGAPEAAEERFDYAELLRTGGNIGYGAAINRAVAEIAGRPEEFRQDLVLVVNPDVTFRPGSIDALLDATGRWPRAGALGPRIAEPDGTDYPSARELPTPGTGIGHALLAGVWPGNPFTARYRAGEDMSTERAAGWLSGSCLLLRREAFDGIGRFDDRYFMYFEDVDLGDRLGLAGWQNVFVPSAVIAHDRGHAADAVPEFTLRAHHASAYRYLADRHRGLAWAPFRVAVRAGLAVRLQLKIRRSAASGGTAAER